MMNKYKLKDLCYSFLMMFVLISISVCIVLFCKQIYYIDIHLLKITDYVNLSVEKIKQNYDILINYQSIFYKGKLVFQDFWMSQSGEHHFEEVKVVFEVIQYVAIIGGVLGLILSVFKYIKKDYIYFKYVGRMTFIIPLIIGGLAAINFDQAFVLFHKIVFHNNDWIFDPAADPVINILPEDFFMHCFILIILVVWILCLFNILISKHLEKKWLKDE